MRILLTLSAFLVGFSAISQTTFWNPDADGNGIVGASDLLPFLEIFGGSFSATPLYCQDTASVTVNFPFGPNQPSNQLTEYAPLASTIFITADGNDQFRYADLYLPIDSVPNGYRSLVINVSNLAYSIDVFPCPYQTTDDVERGMVREFVFYEGLWYPHD